MSGKKILVLGGTGLVGAHVCREGVLRGMAVTSFTRSLPHQQSEAMVLKGFDASSVEWRTGDVTSDADLAGVIKEVKPDAVVHCVGALFDARSWLAGANVYMSGSRSTPSCTYEDLVTKPLLLSLEALAALGERRALVFVSAAEVGWAEGEKGVLGRVAGAVAPPFLQRYLQAKRRGEEALAPVGHTRCVVWRPSLITTDSTPRFGVAQAMQFSPVGETPVHASKLARAILASVEDEAYKGVYRVRDM